MDDQERTPAWLRGMSDEDLGFIKRFVLASGSLKRVAGEYDISYPTVRLRLDRLIEKVKIYDSQSKVSDFERLLAAALVDGKVDQATFMALLGAYREEANDVKDE